MPCSAWKVPWAPGEALGHDLGVFVDQDRHGSGPLHGSDDLLRRVGQVVGGDDGEAAIGQDLLAEVDIGAFEPHDQRHRSGQGLGRGDDPLGDHVALGDAAEDVHQDRLDVGVRVMIRNASVTRAAFALPPTSRKLAGDAPYSLMMSMVAMARPAPFTMQPMSPSSAT